MKTRATVISRNLRFQKTPKLKKAIIILVNGITRTDYHLETVQQRMTLIMMFLSSKTRHKPKIEKIL